MKNTIIVPLVILAVAGFGVGLWWIFSQMPQQQMFSQNGNEVPRQEEQQARDPLNASYTVGKEDTQLADGRAEKAIVPGSATKTVTSVAGQVVHGDLDGDGDEDAALLLVQESGGSGAFYYAAAAIQEGGVWRGTNTVLLGDRIAPQSMGIKNGIVAAVYLERLPEEPMTTPPSQSAITYAMMDGGELVQVAYHEDLAVLMDPKPKDTISSPLQITGKARGNWYFEATFPLVLADWDGRIIAEGFATAQGEWMTEDYVPFEGTLEFEKPQDIGEFSRRGALILQKSNPSGLPENDAALEITVFFE